MEVEENRRSASSKRPRHSNLIGERDDNEDDDDANEARAMVVKNNNNTNNISSGNNNSRILRQWHQQSSRIFRVSRASGGKDRHSKVYTAKGLRDRRVRLSVSTAIQFYDLQDRLGYDQPSKAIEWLIKAADSAIAELPSLDTNFPPGPPDEDENIARPKQEMIAHNADVDADADPSYNQHSSASETSKGSVLSLTSRSEIREKARERARERAAKDKDRQKGQVFSVNAHNLNPQSSFTELLTGGGGGNTSAATATREGGNSGGANFFQKHMQPVTSTTDYFTQFGQQQQQQQQQQKSTTHDHHQNIPSGFFGNNNNSSSSNSPIGMVQFGNAAGGDHHHQHQHQQHQAEMQQFAFLQQDHYFPVAAATSGGDNYNLNFSISSGLASFRRGTLQSNSPSHHHQFPHHHHQNHHQHVQVDGAGVPFLFGTAAATAAAAHEGQYPAGYDSHLQLCDGYKHMELKGKGKG